MADGQTVSDQDCQPTPAAPVIDKSVSAGPAPSGLPGSYDIQYKLDVTNASAAAGVYNVVDALQLSPTVTTSIAIVAVAPAGVTTNPGWNGTSDQVIATNQAIPAATVHTYLINVRFSINAAAVTFANSDCTLDAGESGTGLLNSAAVGNNNIITSSDTGCAPLPS